MPKRDLLLRALKKYKTSSEWEQKMLFEMIDFIQKNPNCFERSNLSGHITGSAWLLNPDERKVLLTHHKKLNRWLQLGGHSDGQNKTWDVALREASEESGIKNISFIIQEIFDIDIHIIPENTTKNEPEHKHYDVRFLMKSPTEDFIVSKESNSLKWVCAQKLFEMYQKKEISEAMLRMTKKWLARNR